MLYSQAFSLPLQCGSSLSSRFSSAYIRIIHFLCDSTKILWTYVLIRKFISLWYEFHFSFLNQKICLSLINSRIQNRGYNIAHAYEMLTVEGLLVEQIGWHEAQSIIPITWVEGGGLSMNWRLVHSETTYQNRAYDWLPTYHGIMGSRIVRAGHSFQNGADVFKTPSLSGPRTLVSEATLCMAWINKTSMCLLRTWVMVSKGESTFIPTDSTSTAHEDSLYWRIVVYWLFLKKKMIVALIRQKKMANRLHPNYPEKCFFLIPW